MEDRLNPIESVLHAQVRNAGPSHGHDEDGNLRPKAHPANVATVYLGDIATILLKVLQGHSTPVVTEKPRFDEQKWEFTTLAGDLVVKVTSYPYWGFGLLTRCYANTITLEGPLAERCRLIFDLVAALEHKPWEFSWQGRFSSKHSSTKENHLTWVAHVDRGREDLAEMIEQTLQAKGDSPEIEIARNALADDNAPAVLRALSRLEADSIDIEVEDVSPDGMVLEIEDDSVPLVDLSGEEE